MESWKERFAESNARRSAEVAHDLKTPLNVAVLNLELARMKARRIAESGDDDSISGYLRAVEGELRRIARIFDAYFVYSVPPETTPELVDLGSKVAEEFSDREIAIATHGAIPRVRMHEERASVLAANLVEGALAAIDSASGSFTAEDGDLKLVLQGVARKADEEVSRIFKFYYTDASGNPSFGLATARLIAESYGGSLESRSEDGGIAIELRFPAGDE